MTKIKLKNILTGFGMICIVLTLMPFVALDYWWIRMFDFPHLQLTFLTFFAILFYSIKFDFNAWRDYLFTGVLVLCSVFQFSKIYPYTNFADYEVFNSKKGESNLTLFTSNVLQTNSEYELVQSMSKVKNADIMLFTETDKKWRREIRNSLDNSYIHHVEFPLDNTYGMLLYSKLDLFDTSVEFMVSDSVPSIHTKVKLASNDTIQLYAIHPTPPMPQENPKSTDRDAEMMMVAKLALDSKYPVIVIGDFNDVAWSQTSKLFQRVSRLLDLRKGRGLYNTYNANSYIMRWPLDHIFISSEFRLKHLELCDDVNSDHFPLYIELSFEPEQMQLQKSSYPSEADIKSAEDQIKKFKENKE